MTRVFVYGSLRRGLHNHGLLADAKFVGLGRTEPRFRLVDLGAYPALLAGGTTAVVGELYDVNASTLARLDRLEGHPTHYRREPLELAGGQKAEIYVFVAELHRWVGDVPSGDWCEHKEKRE